jgi:hypothetical protein
LYKGAFIATMDSGHTGVFMHGKGKPTTVSKKASAGTNRKNLPIVEIRLPSVASTMVQKDIDKRLRDYAWPVYEKELIRQMNLEMKKAGAK